jgi:hypothetical protein
MDNANPGVTILYHLYVNRIYINFAVHSHRTDAELFRSANDTTRDFSPE